MSVLDYIRERYHPLHRARGVPLVRQTLRLADVAVWAPVPGIRWKVRVRAVSHLSYLLLRESPESGLTAFVQAAIELFQPRSFWDVGANFGYYGLLAKSLDERIDVTFCEPDPDNAALIRSTLGRADLSGIALHEIAVSDHAGVSTFSLDRVSHATGTLEDGISSFAYRHWRQHDALPVETARLDDLVAESARVEMLKIDVEGHEERVFEGAMRTIERCRPIVIFECFHGGGEIASRLAPLDYLLLDGATGREPGPGTDNFVALPERCRRQLDELRRSWRVNRP